MGNRHEREFSRTTGNGNLIQGISHWPGSEQNLQYPVTYKRTPATWSFTLMGMDNSHCILTNACQGLELKPDMTDNMKVKAHKAVDDARVAAHAVYDDANVAAHNALKDAGKKAQNVSDDIKIGTHKAVADAKIAAHQTGSRMRKK